MNKKECVVAQIHVFRNNSTIEALMESAVEHYKRGDYAESFECFQTLAEQGDSVAQYNVAAMYHRGEGVERNDLKSLEYCEKAATQGYGPALTYLGVVHAEGTMGQVKNYEKAIEYFEKALEYKEDNADAHCQLGFLYEQGLGVAQDKRGAVRLYAEAAKKGHVGAQCNLGNAYSLGCGVEQSYDLAIFWYEKSMKQGCGPARDNLSNLKLEIEGGFKKAFPGGDWESSTLKGEFKTVVNGQVMFAEDAARYITEIDKILAELPEMSQNQDEDNTLEMEENNYDGYH